MSTFHSSFIDDLAEHHRDMLVAAEYELPGDATLEECTQLYFNVRFRTIEPAPRRVHEAKNLRCPPGMEDAFEAFKLKVIGGADLNAHLSRKLKKPRYQDRLLTQWGVQHFHIALTKDKRGFFSGQSVVLFGKVTATDVFLAYFGPHERADGGDGFNDIEILDELHRNWPDAMGGYLPPGASVEMGKETLSPQEWADLVRPSNVLFPVKLSDGSVHMPELRTMSGLSWNAARAMDDAMTWCTSLEEKVRATAVDDVAGALPAGTLLPDELRLKLLFDADGKPFVQELMTRVVILVPDPEQAR